MDSTNIAPEGATDPGSELNSVPLALFQTGTFSKTPVGVISAAGWIEWQRTGRPPADENAIYILTAEEWKGRRAEADFRQTSDDRERRGHLDERVSQYREALAKKPDDALFTKGVKEWKKNNLPCVAWGWRGEIDPVDGRGFTIQRAARLARSINPLICFDVDGIRDEAHADAVRDSLRDIPFVVAAGKSVSGRGTWFVVAVDRLPVDAAEYKSAWWYVALHLVRDRGMTVERLDPKKEREKGGADTAPSNAVSLRFASHDPDAWIKPDTDVEPFALPPAAELPNQKECEREITAVLAGAESAENNKEPEAHKSPETDKCNEHANPFADAVGAPAKPWTAGPSGLRAKAPVPPWGGRIAWVEAAEAEGEARHDRMCRATFRDVLEGRVPDDARVVEYDKACGGGREDEIRRAISGAEEKAAESAERDREEAAEAGKATGGGESDAGQSGPFTGGLAADGNPYTHLRLPNVELVKVENSDGEEVWLAKDGTFSDSDIRTSVLIDGTLPPTVVFLPVKENDDKAEWRVWSEPPSEAEALRRAAVRGRGMIADSGGGWDVDQTAKLCAYTAAAGRQVLGRNTDKGWTPNAATGGSGATAKRVIGLLTASDGRRTQRTDWNKGLNTLGLPDGQCLAIDADGWTTRPQRAGDRITRSLPTRPAPDWRETPFADLLKRVPEADWLQRAFGYALVGGGCEPVFVWLRGAPQSGKSTLISYVVGALGGGAATSYARAVAPDMLLTRKGNRHLQEIARLHEARLVTWSEAKAGGVLDSEEVKRWTSGGQDTLTGNFMRENAFEFTPKFLLTAVSNDNLSLSAPDPALTEERVRLIDGWETIPKSERLVDHSWKSKSGDAGALAWIAEGASGWLKQSRDTGGKSGLLPETDSMRANREEWSALSNPVARFFNECVEFTPGRNLLSRNAYAAFLAWSAREGVKMPPALNTFTARFTEEGQRRVGPRFELKVVRDGDERSNGWAGTTMNADFAGVASNPFAGSN